MSDRPYWQKLRDPRWQRLRLEVMSAAEFCCERCGAGEMPLNVHHRRYVKGRDPWEYAKADLICVCEDCHEAMHADREQLLRAAGMAIPMCITEDDLAALIVGYLIHASPVALIDSDGLIGELKERSPFSFAAGEVAGKHERDRWDLSVWRAAGDAN